MHWKKEKRPYWMNNSSFLIKYVAKNKNKEMQFHKVASKRLGEILVADA